MIKPKIVESTQIVQSPIVLGRIEDSTCDFLSSEFVDINIKLQQGNCLLLQSLVLTGRKKIDIVK